MLGALDAQIQWSEAEGSSYAQGNPYIGPDAVLSGVFMRLISDVADLTLVPQRFIDGGSSVVVEGRYSGTMKGTGTALDAPFAHIWELRDGKVVRFQQYTDTLKWAVTAGRRA